MLNAVALYFRLISVSMRSQLQYRASTLMLAFGVFFVTMLEFAGIVFLFQRFGALTNWTLPEVAIIYSLVHISLGLGDAVAGGFNSFSSLIRDGGFDRVLLRPRSAALQITGSEFTLRRFGRITQAAAVLIWAMTQLDIDWTAMKVMVMVAGTIGGTSIFFGLFILEGTMCFWSVQTLELMNILTYGGTETAQFPIDIYAPFMRRLFIFAVPLACANYFPVLYVLGKPDPLGFPTWLGLVSPLAGIVFLLVTLKIWQFGVRHYRSTGS